MHVANQFLSNPDHFGPLEPRSPVASRNYRAHAGMRIVCPICPYLSLVTAVAFFALSIVVLAVL
jgi:hypothetical protein